ncbi:NUDIX hydrolase [Sansalvadorimonas sp. 2012CJ34-2]|uniref:NUDIX hydrolase n=1 Tax=Parendozoicomonas callyspongiae TaxID=2942213 RepID=A0ABT0PCV5_9GAMM|nr:NUDIX hydrolase [Sansalvadorimonas sp. 2012CJ34-2]MCL6268582.1 NUDIX hydrolase [Sansalvadorimonas sp. 2012CJ34-2]
MNNYKTMIPFSLLAALLPITFILAGCQKPSLDSCPYSTDEYQPANAGCLITKEDEVVIVTMRRSGKQTIPGGTSEKGETARCTAYRETFEETGIRVSVHEMLAEFSNGFQLYRCKPIAVESSPLNPDEISDVSWRSWLSLNTDNWRYPEFFIKTRRLIREQITGISKELE